MKTRKGGGDDGGDDGGAALLDVIDWAFDKASWHGPNLASSVRGLRADDAARSLRGRKSIWQQLLHAAYWKQRVLNKLAGTQPFPRKGSNWPLLPDQVTQAAWRRDLELLRDIHCRFRAAVVSLQKHGAVDDKLRRLIVGGAFHDVYHAGQIRLLRKMLRENS
jgi:hypothetical protein